MPNTKLLGQIPVHFQKIGRNTLILLAVNLVAGLSALVMGVILGRALGDRGFGQYSLVMSWLASLVIFLELGLSTLLTRDLAATPQATAAYLANSLVIKWGVLAPLLLLMPVLAPLLAPADDPEIGPALVWGVLFLAAGLGFSSFSAVFKAHQRMSPILYATAAGQAMMVGGVLVLVVYNYPLASLILWVGVSQAAQLLLAFILYRRLLPDGSSPGSISNRYIKILLRRAWPFALAGILAILQLRTGHILLAYLDSTQALGWYSAASRLIETGRQLPGAFFAALLPAMSAIIGTAALPATRRYAQVSMLLFAVIAAVAALLLGSWLIFTLYGAGYEASVSILQILALSLIPALQNSVLIIFLYANGDENFVNLMIGLGAILNIGLCLLLIPGIGAAGTAWALLITESVLYWPYKLRSGSIGGKVK